MIMSLFRGKHIFQMKTTQKKTYIILFHTNKIFNKPIQTCKLRIGDSLCTGWEPIFWTMWNVLGAQLGKNLSPKEPNQLLAWFELGTSLFLSFGVVSVPIQLALVCFWFMLRRAVLSNLFIFYTFFLNFDCWIEWIEKKN